MNNILFLFISFLSTLSLSLCAQAEDYVLDNRQSQINFVATQNNAPVKGEFKTFSGQLKYKDSDLNNAEVNLVIDTPSLFTSYGLIADELKKEGWLDVKKYAQAKFQGKGLTQNSDHTYSIQGTLLICDKSLPQTITFELSEPLSNQIQAQGSFSFKRLDFGLGQKEWADLSEIQNDVKIQFHLLFKKG